MLGWIALLGALTATLASWLIESVRAKEEPAEDLQATVRRLAAKVDLPCDRAETRPPSDGHHTAGKHPATKLGAYSVSPIRRMSSWQSNSKTTSCGPSLRTVDPSVGSSAWGSDPVERLLELRTRREIFRRHRRRAEIVHRTMACSPLPPSKTPRYA